ncbi:MAG TPA: tRNA 2-thiouridine(34) synthase MnmA, partial [Succinivibrio sp.]|nr:tRNA 2-thiouridine(34) synthase MnmA [Succinivibrio sp.]
TIYRDGQNLKVMFKNPVAAVAPGQSVVFYDGMDCLGGAVIDKHIKE